MDEHFREKYRNRWEVDRQNQKKRFVHRYNQIPNHKLRSPVLEIGPGEGLRQVVCRHKEFFLNADYLGVDLLKPLHPELNIVQGDFNDFFSSKKFNTIILVGVLEHFPLDDWPAIVEKLKLFCKPKGNIILYVPFKESIDKYMIHDGDHLVFGITKKFMHHFFPGAAIKYVWNPMMRDQGESILWALGRVVKRIFTLNRLVFNLIPRRVGLLIVWEKP